MQMQAGTTGINVPRVYNPIKQAHDHDPKGIFVRRWLPAMRKVPDLFLFEPWTMPADVQAAYGVEVGRDIPVPVVDLEVATREAKAKLFAVRGQAGVKAAKSAVVKKHGSRNTRSAGSTKRAGKSTKRVKQQDAGSTSDIEQAPQLGFDF
jgi:deoxyribodipyrimidine photo-lyase